MNKNIFSFSVMFMCFISICLTTTLSLAGQDKGNRHVETMKQKKSYISVIYFHGDFRCSSCIKIEQYSREAIEKFFTSEIKSGELRSSVLNMDKPENKHFIKDYQLYTRSLVVAMFKNGKQVRWKNLGKVWQYLDDRDAFYDYVQKEVRSFLEAL